MLLFSKDCVLYVWVWVCSLRVLWSGTFELAPFCFKIERCPERREQTFTSVPASTALISNNNALRFHFLLAIILVLDASYVDRPLRNYRAWRCQRQGEFRRVYVSIIYDSPRIKHCLSSDSQCVRCRQFVHSLFGYLLCAYCCKGYMTAIRHSCSHRLCKWKKLGTMY